MAPDASSLASKLAELVVPNYPFLQGTSLPVLDFQECARRGTAEQRQVARQARETMEHIWELEDGHPLRQLLQDFQKGCETRQRCRVGAGPGEQIDVERQRQLEPAAHSRTLPTELVHRALDIFMSEVSPPDHALQFIAFGRLLLVSKAIANYARDQHQYLFVRYTDRVVSHVVHGKSPENAKVASVVYPFATLLGQVRTLNVYLYGDEIDRLNAVLPVLTELTSFTIYIHSDDVPICLLGLDHNKRLRDLSIHPPDTYIESDTWSDIHVKRDRTEEEEAALQQLLEDHREPWAGHPWSSARQLSLEANGGNWEDRSTALECFRYLVIGGGLEDLKLGSTEVGLVELQQLGLTTLQPPQVGAVDRGVRILDVSSNERVDDEAVRSLVLGQPLVSLNLGSCQITDPSALALASNDSITRLRLSYNPLASGTLGLAANKMLRILDCSCCFRNGDSDGRQRFLRELSADLKLNTTLEELHLSGGFYGALEDVDLAELDLSGHIGLRRLHLSNNPKLTAAGIKDLRLRTNATLQELLVSDYDDFVKGWEAEEDSVVRIVGRGEPWPDW